MTRSARAADCCRTIVGYQCSGALPLTIWIWRRKFIGLHSITPCLLWLGFTLPTKIDGSIGNACFQRASCGAPSMRQKCWALLPFRDGWIDQLYVLPSAQGRGVGSRLLGVAQREFDQLLVWTFQRNILARRFYTARGFQLVRETAGVRNEEKQPDALYRWTRHA